MSQHVVPLDAHYLGSHRYPTQPDPQAYEELRIAVNGLIADAARWLDANGPVQYLHLCTIAVRARETCCVGKLFLTDIRPLDLDPDVGAGPHVPCFVSVPPLEPGGLTGEYVRAHALPEVADPASYDPMRDAINQLIREAADWLNVNGPKEYLNIGYVTMKAEGECCIRLPFISDIRALDIFPAREGHVPC